MLLREEATESREVAPCRRGTRGIGMMGSVEKLPRLPISVEVRNMEAIAGLSMSCCPIAVAEPREGPREAADRSEARLSRPEGLGSRSACAMMTSAYPYRRPRRVEGSWLSKVESNDAL